MLLNIAKAKEVDIERIRSMALVAFPYAYKDILSKEQSEYMLNMMYSPESILEQMRSGHEYFIALSGAEDCGYVSIQRQTAELFHLQKIYVMPEFQGMGVGGFMSAQAIKCIKQIRPEKCTIELNVNRNNKALGFYKHLGMRKVRQGDFPIGGGFFMNDYIMSVEI